MHQNSIQPYKEGSPVKGYNMGWTLRTLCYMKYTVTKWQILYNSTYVKCLE